MNQARLAQQHDEVPIGAVIIHAETDEIIASSFNQTITKNDPTAHAEILAIREACGIMGAQRIPECDLYVTLEPCPMCAAAISFARIRHVFFTVEDIKSGGFISGPNLRNHSNLHHKPDYSEGLYAKESATLLRDFFKEKRQLKQKQKCGCK